MRPRKGVIDLVQAMRELAPDTNIHLLLVGEVCDPRLPRLVDQYHLSSSVHFTGFRDDAVSIIGAGDVMVMPSWSEGLTRAVLEAMAQAVPPIVTRVGGLREMVEDGVSGLLVPPRDPPALARAIRELASDPARRARLGQNARDRMRALFNIEQTVDQTLAMYREMLG
jgi:glycosyltransferase involved in cell wall biosynthesis